MGRAAKGDKGKGEAKSKATGYKGKREERVREWKTDETKQAKVRRRKEKIV